MPSWSCVTAMGAKMVKYDMSGTNFLCYETSGSTSRDDCRLRQRMRSIDLCLQLEE